MNFMRKLIQIIAIIIIFIIAALYFLDGLEYTEAEKEWCKEHRPYCLLRYAQKSLGIEINSNLYLAHPTVTALQIVVVK